jgi:hypothetical protein
MRLRVQPAPTAMTERFRGGDDRNVIAMMTGWSGARLSEGDALELAMSASIAEWNASDSGLRNTES